MPWTVLPISCAGNVLVLPWDGLAISWAGHGLGLPWAELAMGWRGHGLGLSWSWLAMICASLGWRWARLFIIRAGHVLDRPRHGLGRPGTQLNTGWSAN
jgi:hypothetical protein